MSEQNKALHCLYVEEINKGNLAVLDKYMAGNCVCHGSGVELDSLEACKEHATMTLSAFPDRCLTADDMIVDGDKIVTRWTWSGTHKGEFQGIAPTGKRVTVTGITISQIEDGKVVEEWEEVDRLGLMQQLGVVPPMGQGGD
jgi:predicted ester cyclase